MPKGQIQQWENFWKKQKDKRKKNEWKQRNQQNTILTKRSPFQCSICHNPRFGFKKCYLCNEVDAVVELDWILAQEEMQRTKQMAEQATKGQINTLTQMISMEWTRKRTRTKREKSWRKRIDGSASILHHFWWYRYYCFSLRPLFVPIIFDSFHCLVLCFVFQMNSLSRSWQAFIFEISFFFGTIWICIVCKNWRF